MWILPFNYLVSNTPVVKHESCFFMNLPSNTSFDSRFHHHMMQKIGIFKK